jgi:NADPH-dependent 2,4-dienoyl-CoA reductase/sulfur reductase-like enzyme
LLPEHTAEAIDAGEKQLIVTDHTGIRSKIDYDRLIIATGAVSLKPEIPGMDRPGVFLLRWMPDRFAIVRYIEERQPKTVVIVGAGYIGMEMAEALSKRDVAVTLVEYAESVMPSLDADLGAKLQDILGREGITVINQVSIESIEWVKEQLRVKGRPGFETLADMVIVAVGSSPNTALGKSLGLELGVKGAFKVNRKMETGLPNIYAAGDCAETWHRIVRKYSYLPLGTVAHKQGRIAGENAAGGSREYAGTVGIQSLKIFHHVVARTGLNEKEARLYGFNPVSAALETWDHKAYYPLAEKLFIRVTADRDSGKLLGAQMIGAYKTEVSKRIDILATALYHELSLDEFSDYDLSYTPPLSSPWDPGQMAVQNLEKKIRTLP